MKCQKKQRFRDGATVTKFIFPSFPSYYTRLLIFKTIALVISEYIFAFAFRRINISLQYKKNNNNNRLKMTTFFVR